MKNVSWKRTHRLGLIGLIIAISLEILLPAALTFAQAVSFSAATNVSVGTAGPFSVVIGDLNGDGTPDLAVANQNSNTVSILLGDGIGAFGTATNFAVGKNFYIRYAFEVLNVTGKERYVICD